EEIALKGFTGVEANKYYTDAFQLYKGKIYLLHVSKGKMEIGIFEKSDLKLIKKLEIGEDQLGKLAFQPYHSISRKFAHKASVPTINQIAKILGNNPFGITVEETATGSILLTGGIDNSSAITVSKTDPSRIAYESLRANFKVLLKPDNLDILPGSDKPPIEKIIYDYRRQAGVRIPEFEYFVSQGSLYHAFCKGEKFIIRKLNLDGSSSLSKN
ncbi:MAG TPA: hypothetical protein VK616_03550, partial [Flavitalea sp.]|nr:hypothetical protein [Flavitalea sp.]